MAADPLPLGQLQDEAAIEPARRGKIQVFDGGGQGKAGGFGMALEAAVVSAGALEIHQQRQPLVEGQLGIVGVLPLLLEAYPESG
jgi:hypothetical protein